MIVCPQCGERAISEMMVRNWHGRCPTCGWSGNGDTVVWQPETTEDEFDDPSMNLFALIEIQDESEDT